LTLVSTDQSLAPKIVVAAATESYGRFVVEPLQPGFGATLGNALRRVLLNSLPGASITAVQIEGVQHEYSMLPGIQEDMIDFLLNVKGVRLRSLTGRPGVLRLEINGREGAVTAGDIQPSGELQIVNPEHVLLHLDSAQAHVSIEFHVETGVGYRPAETHNGQVIGLLPVDAVFTPIRRANFEVEPTRVGQFTDYDRLILEVWTDKTISPQDAVQRSAAILLEHLHPFASLGQPVAAGNERSSVSQVIPESLAAMPVEDLKLSSRTQNSLRRGNLATVGQVLEKTAEELLALRNFGDRSLDELFEKLREIGIPVPDADQDRTWRKSPLATLLQEDGQVPAPVATDEDYEPPTAYSAGGDEAEEEEVDVRAFSRRSFAPDDSEE
jgi:DNA-directed RNA polymerase subunit alpha